MWAADLAVAALWQADHADTSGTAGEALLSPWLIVIPLCPISAPVHCALLPLSGVCRQMVAALHGQAAQWATCRSPLLVLAHKGLIRCWRQQQRSACVLGTCPALRSPCCQDTYASRQCLGLLTPTTAMVHHLSTVCTPTPA